MFEKIKELLINELNIEEDIITPEANLVKDLGINSLELADLVLLCEDNFGVTISDNDIRGFSTIADVVAFLDSVE